jgi:hypothetical protein
LFELFPEEKRIMRSEGLSACYNYRNAADLQKHAFSELLGFWALSIVLYSKN